MAGMNGFDTDTLAKIGLGLIYSIRIPNATSRELASLLASNLQLNTTTFGFNASMLMRAILGPNTTTSTAEVVLSSFEGLPHEERNGIIWRWLFPFVLASVVVALRLYSRWIKIGRIRADDWWIVVAWVCS